MLLHAPRRQEGRCGRSESPVAVSTCRRPTSLSAAQTDNCTRSPTTNRRDDVCGIPGATAERRFDRNVVKCC